MFKPLTCTREVYGEADTDWECRKMDKIGGSSEAVESIAAFTIGVALSQAAQGLRAASLSSI